MAWLRAFIRMIIDLFAGVFGGALSSMELLFAKLQALFSFKFTSAWVSSRVYRELLYGLPAGVSFIFIGVVAMLPLDPLRFDVCINNAIQAKQTNNTDLAELFLHKARLTSGGSRQSRLNQAILLASLERDEDARLIISSLAPDDSPGFVPAHQWRVEHFVQQIQDLNQKESPSEDDNRAKKLLRDKIESQLNLILQIEPRNVDANGRLALVALDRGDLERSADCLSRIVDSKPDARLLYAQVLRKKGDVKEATVQASQAAEFHLQQMERQPQQNLLHRLSRSSALLLNRQFQLAAEALLDEGNEIPKEAPLQKALHDILFQWSESLDGSNPSQIAQKMDLLDKALRIRPNDPRVLERIAILAGQDGEAGADARKRLKEVLASGAAPAVVHFILGLHASNSEDRDAAIRHWELAHRINPNTPITLNNLAVIIARQDPPDLERALKLIEKAISMKPEIAEFYDSRGQIYLAMEDYTNAIADLELALQKLKQRGDIHERLAIAYDAVGDEELATIHRAHAVRISESKAEADATKKINADANQR